MNADVVIIGAGPAGIFTALEMIKKGSKQKIIMVEKGQALTRSIWISVRTSTLRVSATTRSGRRSASTPFRRD